MDIKNLLFTLSDLDSVGNISDASDKAYEILSQFAETEKMNNLTVIGFMKGEADYTVMLDAHIDQIALIVTDIDDNGFLTVSNAGGIDIRMLPSRQVTVHGKEKIPAVFCSTPPHLASGEVEYNDISKIKLDSLLGAKAKDVVSVGDYVTFCGKPFEMGNLLCGRSFDDRSGVACILEVASRLHGKKLPQNVAFVLSDGEELGLRGIRTASFKINPQEAIAVDVSFGNGPDISDHDCGKLGDGGMIGVSPALDKCVSQKLIQIAKENNIPYQLEVMSGNTGTNADMISVTREGVKTATLSIPLRNMHTEVETLDVKDLYSVCDLLEKYILSGGVGNA